MGFNETPTKGNIMDTKSKLLIGAAIVFAYDAVVALRNQKQFESLKERHIALVKERNDLAFITNIYITKVRDNHIPLDDFEQIVIADYLKKN